MLDQKFFADFGKCVFAVLIFVLAYESCKWLFNICIDLLLGYRVRLASPREQELIDLNRKESAEYKSGETEVQR